MITCGLISFSIALSAHINEEYTNSVHPGVHGKCNNIIAGAYYNSISQMSYYGGYEYNINDDRHVQGGLATGYEQNEADIVPMLKLGYKDFFAMPTRNGAVLGIEIKLGE